MIPLILLGCRESTVRPPTDTLQHADLGTNFSFKGKPIHPMIVHEFVGLPSNRGPVCRVIDLEAAGGGNRFPQKVKRLRDGTTSCLQDDADDSLGYVAYQHLGVLRNGTHVVITSENGGGSGVFEHLLFVRFATEEVHGADGQSYRWPALCLVDSYPLGDRGDAKIQVFEDRVIVGASKYRKSAEALQEPEIRELRRRNSKRRMNQE